MKESPEKIVELAIHRMKSESHYRKLRLKKIFNSLILLASCITIGYLYYAYMGEGTPPTLNAQIPTSTNQPNGDIVVRIKQDQQGHFTFLGEINEKPVKFILDTGATDVTIPIGIANYLNLMRGEIIYSETANGKALSYSTTLGEITIGGIKESNISASIAPGFESDYILLGMSYLKHLTMLQENGQMVLTKKNQ